MILSQEEILISPDKITAAKDEHDKKEEGGDLVVPLLPPGGRLVPQSGLLTRRNYQSKKTKKINRKTKAATINKRKPF